MDKELVLQLIGAGIRRAKDAERRVESGNEDDARLALEPAIGLLQTALGLLRYTR